MPHKLLLADDSVTIQRVIELTFAEEDVQVIVVGDGKQAIDRVQSERPDIVLADIGMPGRDGYEVAAFIKGSPQFAQIPVVLLTGAFEPIDEIRARSVGCDAVLVKPFEPQMVINRVRELLAGHRPAGWTAAAAAPPPAPARQEAETSRSPIDFDVDLAPAIASPGAEKADGDSLEDYFDRLDAAFASMNAPPSAAKSAPVPHEDLSASIGELDQPPPQRAPSGADVLTDWDPDLRGGIAPGPQPALASAFAALLAAEEGRPVPEGALALETASPPIGDDTIEEVVRRVLARMSDDSMRRLVTETAERVVRDEIERIKRMSASGDPR